MTALVWDQTGEKYFETGVDHGVLYTPNVSGVYNNGFAWNGLTGVTETPSGAESNPQYADNIKYVDILSAETFAGTIEALNYPVQFSEYDGTAQPYTGVFVGQQARKAFGLSYRTRVGNDVSGDGLGYKYHLMYGCLAAPSERAYATVNESPEPVSFSWEVSTTPVPITAVANMRPTSLMVIDSRTVDPTDLTTLLGLLYGGPGQDPQLPTPDEVLAIFSVAGVTIVNTKGANSPTYNTGTHVITFPTVTGVQWKVDGVNQAGGTTLTLTTGQTKTVTARPSSSAYVLSSDSDDDWVFTY